MLKIIRGAKGLMELLDNPVIDPTEVNRKYSNSTAKVLEPFYRPNIANDVRTFDQPPFRLSELEGRGVMFPESDVTAAGYDLVGIGNKPLARPVTMETGVDHIFYAPDNALWKNDASVANKYLKRAKARQAEVQKLGKETGGQDVFLLPYEGGPQSSDWWTGIGRTMINYNLENAPAKSVSLMDEFIKSKIPEWPGSDSPDAEKIWNATGGGTRMEITQALDQMRLEGGLTEGQARVATSRQDRLNIPHGSLQNVGVMDIERGFTPNLSPDYNASTHGEGVGILKQPVTAYDFLLDRTTKSGKPLVPRSLQWQDTSKVVTEQDLKRMQDKGIDINSPAAVGLLSGAGALAALAPQEADASIFGSLSKLGAGRQDLLGMAQKMANEGMDVQSIRERTGWEIGADGQWRTELPNTNTKINIPEVAEGSQYYFGTIADVIDDPELLSQYEKGGRKPTVRDMEGEIEEYGSRGIFSSLGDIAFTVDKNMPEGQGFHREGYFDQFGERQPETIVISGKSSPAEQRATLLHELQHSIQDREGFAAGGNQKQFAEEEKIKDSFYQRVGLTPAGSGRLQELEQKIRDVGQRSMSLQEMSDLERLRVEKQISDRFNADTVGEAGARSPYGMYKGLMGEVEARNVEARDKMSPDFLRATPLELSEDVFEPRSQQIFRAGSDDELFRELEYLKSPDVRSNVPEYREAPVVQEQSFGDMVNEYANINQRAQAAEAQKFGLLMREDARLRDMGSAAFGQVSPELAAYRRSQMLPTIGEIGMGALEGAVDTVDFVSQLPTAISTMTMPKRTPLRDRLGGLLDYSFVDERDQRARDQARLIGGLLSPI